MIKIKNEKEALQMFCHHDKSTFYQKYRTPFLNENDGNVWATDAHHLIIVSPKLLSGEYVKIKQNIPDFSDEGRDIIVDFQMFDKAYKKFELVPEMEFEDGTTDDRCEECNGIGEVQWEYRDLRNRYHSNDFRCPICGGDGKKDLPKKPTGRMVLPDDAKFKVKGVFFNANRVMKCIKAMKMMGFKKMEWRTLKVGNYNLFYVAKGVTFIMMSVRPDDINKGQIVEVEI